MEIQDAMSEPGGLNAHIGGKRLVFVTQRPASVARHAALLSDLGHSVALAETVAEAFASARSCTPDVVFVDIRTALPSPVEVIRKIKAEPRLAAAPVVLLASFDALSEIEKGLLEGACDYLVIDETTPAAMARQMPIWERPA